MGTNPFYGENSDIDEIMQAVNSSVWAENVKEPMIVEILEEFTHGVPREELLLAPDEHGNPRAGFSIHKRAEILVGVLRNGAKVPYLYRFDWSDN